jgi:hypothetical protein
MKVFVPFSEELIEKLGLEMGDLVPFDLDYECLHTKVPPPPARQPQNPAPVVESA